MRLRQIYIDLDGVLGDFDAHYESCFGIKTNRSKDGTIGQFAADPPGFWTTLESNPTFFRTMPKMTDADDLWHGVQSLCRLYRIPSAKILTGLPRMTGVEVQKREWVDEHFGLHAAQATICTTSVRKRTYCQPGDVLIDDWEKYKDLWVGAGGIFITHLNAVASLALLREVLR